MNDGPKITFLFLKRSYLIGQKIKKLPIMCNALISQPYLSGDLLTGWILIGSQNSFNNFLSQHPRR